MAAVLALVLAAGLFGLSRLLPRSPAGPTAASSPLLPAPSARALLPTTAPTPAGYRHVVVIVLENHSYESVIGSSQAPYLNSLARQWSLATDYSGVAHPSLPNYLALIGGGTFGVSSDCTARVVDVVTFAGSTLSTWPTSSKSL